MDTVLGLVIWKNKNTKLQCFPSWKYEFTACTKMTVLWREHKNCCKSISRPQGDFGESKDHIWFGKWGTYRKILLNINFSCTNSCFKKHFLPYFKNCSWFTMLCQFLLYSKVTQSHVCTYIHTFSLPYIIFHHGLFQKIG